MADDPSSVVICKVFISYSHDSAEHKTAVRHFADRLRADGVDARLDQYVDAPPEGWPKWMQHQLTNCDFVILVCTDSYRVGVEGTSPSETGLGRRWEGALIYQYIYNEGSLNTRFIPVLPGNESADAIPLPLRGTTWYRIDDMEGYGSLLRRLIGQSAEPPSIGHPPPSGRISGDAVPAAKAQLAKPPLRVFLCHSSADKKTVRNLYQQLLRHGITPWLDEENLIPGQDWDEEIRRAIRATDVILVCLSRRATTRQGYLSQEINHALNAAREKSAGTLFIIPVRLEKCEVPLGLQQWHWVDLHQADGFRLLIRALQKRASDAGALLPADPADAAHVVPGGRGKRIAVGALGLTVIGAAIAYWTGLTDVLRPPNNTEEKAELRITASERDLCTGLLAVNGLGTFYWTQSKRVPVLVRPGDTLGSLWGTPDLESLRRDPDLRINVEVSALSGLVGAAAFVVRYDPNSLRFVRVEPQSGLKERFVRQGTGRVDVSLDRGNAVFNGSEHPRLASLVFHPLTDGPTRTSIDRVEIKSPLGEIYPVVPAGVLYACFARGKQQ